MCTREEICAVMGLSEKTLNRLIDENLREELSDDNSPVSFKDAFPVYSAFGTASIRRKIHQKAIEEGDTRLLLRLGEQYCGLSPSPQVVVSNDNNGQEFLNAVLKEFESVQKDENGEEQ